MVKIALLIGVSKYHSGLTPLPASTKDVEAMYRVLQNPELGDFDQVNKLVNPNKQEMEEQIEAAFASTRKKDDLVLLFFSGHGVKDERGRLYLANRITRKTEQGELIKATAVAASFIHDIMDNCRSRRQVVILDCCFSGAFAEGLLAKDDGRVDVRTQLGGEGRAILTSSSSMQYSFEQKGLELSIYTNYLVEGIKTGAADQDCDRMISVDELHGYAKEKVQAAVPAMKPEIYAIKEGYKILLAKAPIIETLPLASSEETLPASVPNSGKKNISSAPPPVQAPTDFVPISSNPPTLKESSSLNRQEYRHRQILLNKVRNAWIKGVLEKSLHGQVMIALGLEERLNMVESPAALVWETSNQHQQTLPLGTKVIDQFDELGIGRTLLILGEPGSGKTITLLELARDLINRAERDVNLPMPVVLNLSSWKGGKQTIADWLIVELNNQYQVSKDIGKVWVKEGKLLLLLDGLDEVRNNIRDNCTQALNRFIQQQGETEMVVCSRIKDYAALKSRLHFQAAISVQPLKREQIQQYLTSVGDSVAAVSTALQTDSQLQELAASPLMLNIMAIAYQGMSVEDLPSMNLEQRRQQIFNAYIDRMFSRRGADDRYPKPKAMGWLIWLAQRMVQESQTVFLIERMQPSWLQTSIQRWMYVIGILFIFLLLVWLMADRHYWTLFIQVSSIIFGSLICWFLFGFHSIKTVERLKWSGFYTIKHIAIGGFLGSVLGVVIRIILELTWRLLNPNTPISHSSVESVIRGITFGLSIGLLIGIIRGITGNNIDTKTIPNQGIWQSLKNSIFFALIGFILLAAIANRVTIWSIFFLGTFGLIFGFAAGGGEACVKHLSLRLILYFNKYIPWNYARFLDYATERIFLQKVGGGYIFIHRLLLEHFASMSLNNNRSRPFE
ncbi:MAG: NACHT domain-containing protein [Symploca sp. SIO1C4]|uniref:NACHT domain-containing protein n=1 Tax=Symploca sp. SIO1C4 TaxID=2607765 RepID=A0A6B3NCF9_9CYAN|nr:NACHT domain-containing protein [Symploca sp. SIO1C4]